MRNTLDLTKEEIESFGNSYKGKESLNDETVLKLEQIFCQDFETFLGQC